MGGTRASAAGRRACTEAQRARAEQIDGYHDAPAAEKGESLTDEFAARIAASGDVEDLLGEIQAAVDDDGLEVSAAQIDVLRGRLRETLEQWRAEVTGAGGRGDDAARRRRRADARGAPRRAARDGHRVTAGTLKGELVSPAPQLVPGHVATLVASPQIQTTYRRALGRLRRTPEPVRA